MYLREIRSALIYIKVCEYFWREIECYAGKSLFLIKKTNVTIFKASLSTVFI